MLGLMRLAGQDTFYDLIACDALDGSCWSRGLTFFDWIWIDFIAGKRCCLSLFDFLVLVFRNEVIHTKKN